MALDEAKLGKTIKSLETKIVKSDTKTSQMKQVLKNLMEIRLRTPEAQPGEDEPAKISPINVRTNQPFTDAERLKSYNDNMPRASAFSV